MGRFTMNDADNYSGQSNAGSFFSLKEDKETAKVRFLYNSVEDVPGYAVHRVKVGDKERYVNCLRNYNDPADMCPFCAAGIKATGKLFLKLYNEDTKQVQTWERSTKYFQKLASLSQRYNPLCNEIIEIERNGKPHDLKTEYVFYPIENSQVNLEDYEDVEPLGTIILDKTADDMNYYLNVGDFPSDSAKVASGGGRSNSEDRPITRRTPSANRQAF